MATDLGPWEPLELEEVVAAFASAPFRWWICGGLSFELHLGRRWREHGDTDVGVVRAELASLHRQLSSWDLHIAAAGRLTPWGGEPLEEARDQNNIWCRVEHGGPWVLDIAIGEGAPDHWIYRRDRSLELPWDTAVLHTADGVPYLAPEVQLLFKHASDRPKDDLDAAEVIPVLEDQRRRFLDRWLPTDHRWRQMLH